MQRQRSIIKTSSKPKAKIAFGISEPRFLKWPLHPDLDVQGCYRKKCLGQETARYYPIEIKDAFEVNKNMEVCPWAKKYDIQQWSANIGYRNPKILKERRDQKRKLGPAWHEVKEQICAGSICQNVGFGVGKRFKVKRCDRPPPGIYYHEVPYKVPYGPHSKIQSFDWSEPCRFKDRTPPWFVAPNRYKVRDFGTQEELAKRVVSLRGPYDLFTPLRNEYSIKNHFGVGSKCESASFPIALEGSLERLKKRRLGIMCETGRDKRPSNRNTLTDIALAYRCPDEPGPANYQSVYSYSFKNYKYGFNSSDDKPRNYTKIIVWPAVGRYDPVLAYEPLGNGHRSRFLCKIKRTMGANAPQPMNSF